MLHGILRVRPSILISISFLAVAGCQTNTGRNVDAFGPPATQAEIVSHFSGRFVRLQEGGTYFGEGGSLRSVDRTGRSNISLGTWEATRQALCLVQNYYWRRDGQTGSSGPERSCYFVFIRPDGTSVFDPVGMGENYFVAKPVAGFPIAARFNALRRHFGVLTGNRGG